MSDALPSVEGGMRQGVSAASPNLEETEREDELRANRRARQLQATVSLASIAFMLIAWELVARIAIHDIAILPAPSNVLRTFTGHLWTEYPAQSLTLPGHLLVSFLRILAGFAAGSIVGIVIGAAMSVNKYVRFAV